MSKNVLCSTAKRNPQRPVETRSGTNTAGELEVLENNLSPTIWASAPASQATVVISPASTVLISPFLLCSQAQCDFGSRTLMLPFSVPMVVELRQTGVYQFQQPCSKKKKQLDGMHACMKPPASILSVETIRGCRSMFPSSSVMLLSLGAYLFVESIGKSP